MSSRKPGITSASLFQKQASEEIEAPKSEVNPASVAPKEVRPYMYQETRQQYDRDNPKVPIAKDLFNQLKLITTGKSGLTVKSFTESLLREILINPERYADLLNGALGGPTARHIEAKLKENPLKS